MQIILCDVKFIYVLYQNIAYLSKRQNIMYVLSLPSKILSSSTFVRNYHKMIDILGLWYNRIFYFPLFIFSSYHNYSENAINKKRGSASRSSPKVNIYDNSKAPV